MTRLRQNLESVQGDERDVILFSLGYDLLSRRKFNVDDLWFNDLAARDSSVAITRATTEVIIFSILTRHDRLRRTQATAVAHLKNYLDLQRRSIALAEQAVAEHGIDQFDN